MLSHHKTQQHTTRKTKTYMEKAIYIDQPQTLGLGSQTRLSMIWGAAGSFSTLGTAKGDRWTTCIRKSAPQKTGNEHQADPSGFGPKAVACSLQDQKSKVVTPAVAWVRTETSPVDEFSGCHEQKMDLDQTSRGRVVSLISWSCLAPILFRNFRDSKRHTE